MNSPFVVPPELHWLWSATWQAAVLAALVLLVQTLGRNWLSPANRFVLWWLVLIRLCLPITPESAWSVFNLVPQRAVFHSPQSTVMDTTGHGTVTGDRASIELASEARIDVATLNATESTNLAAVGKSDEYQARRESVRSPWSWIFWLWLFGAIGYGARLLIASLLLGRDLRQRQPLRDSAVGTLLEDCRQLMGIRSQIELIETSKVQSPALFGLVRPRLLLPSGFLRAFTVTEIRHVMMHELAHLRRGDLWLNWLMVSIQAVYWFNPLVYLLFARIRSDRELACDALAMDCISEPDRNTYGQTVLKLVERLAVPIPAPGLVGVLEDRRSIERRVRSIIGFRPDRSRPWATVVVGLFLAAFTLTDALTTSPTQVGVREGDSSETKAASTTIERSTHPAYTVAGRLEIHFPTWDAMQAGEFSPVRHVDEYAFTIASDGPRWTMRIRPVRVKEPEPEDLPPGTRVFPSEVLAASDGTEFAVVTSLKPPGEFPPEAYRAAARGPGAEPFEVAQNISVIWYTYASHAALARNEEDMLVSMEILGWRWGHTRGRVPGTFTLTDSIPHLPEQVALHSYEVWGRLLDADTARTNSFLQVNAFTNVHGLSIPLETTIEHRHVRWQRGRLHSTPSMRYRLHTLSVEPAADLGEYPPPITGRFSIRDFRRSGISSSQRTTDGWD